MSRRSRRRRDNPGSRSTASRNQGGMVGAFAGAGGNQTGPLMRGREPRNSQATRRPPTQPNPPGNQAPEGGERDYVLWIHLGAESVFFYPPGSVEEHLVIDHGIPSVDMHWKVKGYYSHEGDHHKQQGIRSGAVGDLLAVTHGHKQAA